MRILAGLPNQASAGMPVFPRKDSGNMLLDMDPRTPIERGNMRKYIVNYLNKDHRCDKWSQNNKEFAAGFLEQDLFHLEKSEMDYKELSTLETRLAWWLNELECTGDNKKSAHNIPLSYFGLKDRTSEMPSSVKAPSERISPQNVVASITDCANVAPNIAIQPSMNPPNSSLFGNGLCASQRYIPNGHHRVVAQYSARSGGNVMHCPLDKHEMNIVQPVPMRSTHYNGGAFSDGATVVSPEQYVGCPDNNVVRNNCHNGRSTKFQMPSSGISDKLGGKIAANTCALQVIGGNAAPEGCMDSRLCGVSNNPSSFSSGWPSNNMNPSRVYSYLTIDSAARRPWLNEWTGQRSTQVEEGIVQLPLMDSAKLCSEQGHLSQPRQLKRELQPSSPLYNHPDQLLQKQVSVDNRTSGPLQSDSISNGYCVMPDQMLLEPFTMQDVIHQPQTSLDFNASDRSLASSGVAIARVCGKTEDLKYEKAHNFLFYYLHFITCSRQQNQCKDPGCLNVKERLMHIRYCNEEHCANRCLRYRQLVVHYRTCRENTCCVCGPVRMKCKRFYQGTATSDIPLLKAATSFIGISDSLQPPLKRAKMENSSHSCQSETSQVSPLIVEQSRSPQGLPHVCPEMSISKSNGTESRKLDAGPFMSSVKDIPLSKAATSFIGISDSLQPPLKRAKMENSSHSCQSETSQVSPLIVEQSHSPQGLPHVCPEMSISKSNGTESRKLDAGPFMSSVKESHEKFHEAKVEDSVEGIKVKLGVKPVNSDNIVAQCEEEIKQVLIDSGELNTEIESNISASSTGHLLGTKLGKPKINGLSLIDSFTPDKVREHIRSLRQSDDQKNAAVDRNQGTEHLIDNNTCSLCGMGTLVFEPPPRDCVSCSTQISPKGTYYFIGSAHGTAYGGDVRDSFCSKCYNTPGNSIKARGVDIPKADLVNAETDAVTEGWVQCDKCEAWQHQICALFNGKINENVQVQYSCPSCFLHEIETGVCKPLPQSKVFAAANLPTTILSDHMEQWLFRRLEKERQERANTLRKSFDEVPGAEDLVVRVVSSVDKKLEVNKHFFEVFHEEKYPAEFPYKSKVILLFQKIEGADVCLFAMYVQEFGSECAFPNQRRICISYIDSVKYFRPEIATVTGEALRTFVYHEILIGYLDYCKKRGFTSCHIWSCPPLKRDDYIMYRHPAAQKMPKDDKLREWYQTMIGKAAKEKIVVEHTNLYDHFFKRSSDCKARFTATRLPYFDGDYWPGEAHDFLQKGDESIHKKIGNKAAIDRVLRAAKRDSVTGKPKDILLMHYLGETIRKRKGDFIMVHLQHTCKHCCQPIVSGNRWICNFRKSFHLCDKCHYLEQKVGRNRQSIYARKKYSYHKVEDESVCADTSDKDELLQSEYFDTRMGFLRLCQGNHYQFDTLRRAKHSTMMILYHLHNSTAPFISSCVVCHSDIDTAQGWYCNTCPDYDLCDACYESGGALKHHHELMSGCNLLPYKGKRRQQQSWQDMLDLLVHASKCTVPCCTYPCCRKLKGLFRHGLECRTRYKGGCKHCKKMWLILKMHAMACKESECSVPRCKDLKEHKWKEQVQSDAQRRAGVNERFRQEAEISGCSS